MRSATNMGVVAALCLITALLSGTLNLAFPVLDFMRYVSLLSSAFGLLFLLRAAVFVLTENRLVDNLFDKYLDDVPELRDSLPDQPTSGKATPARS